MILSFETSVVIVAVVVTLVGTDMMIELVVFDLLVIVNIYCFPESETRSLALRKSHRFQMFQKKPKQTSIETERT